MSTETTVSTDLLDYAPGSTATITASGFIIGSTIEFQVLHVTDPGDDFIYGTLDDVVEETSGEGHETWYVTDGGEGDLDGEANGTIVTTWYVNPDDSLGATFLLTATGSGADGAAGSADDQVATASFTDSTLFDLRSEGTVNVNGAIFSTEVATVGAGTGLIDPFVRIADSNSPPDGKEQGYNTDFNAVVLENVGNGGSNFVHSLLLSSIPVEIVDGIGYRRFELDINEDNSPAGRNLSLDALQIWQANVGNLNSYVPGTTPDQGTGAFPAADATLIYNMDAGGDSFIGLDGNLQSGSGNTVDMSFLVPSSLFDATKPYIYLYSAFGYQGVVGSGQDKLDWRTDSGFEEWVTQTAQTISGHKFEDLDSDGVWDQPGEPGLADWKIYIDVNGDNEFNLGEPFVLTADGVTDDLNNDGVIDPIGFWHFFVAPGSYTIREEVQGGWTQTAPTLPQGEFTVTLLEGQSVTDLNFGNFEEPVPPQLELRGWKWEDLNADGLWGLVEVAPGVFEPAEPGIGEWIIYFDDDTDPDNGFLEQATTDPDGSYVFTNAVLAPHLVVGQTYFVYEDESDTDWIQSYDGGVTILIGDGTATFSFTKNGSFITTAETLSGTEGLPDSVVTEEPLNFGNYQLATKSGFKYQDNNADGLLDAGDTPLENWEIHLDGTDGFGNPVNLVDFTDATGFYSFTVNPGTYTVSEVLQADWIQSAPAGGDYNIVLTSGAVEENNNFLNYLNGSIHGFKFEDKDGDGVYEPGDGESGMPDVWIRLTGDTDGDGDADVVEVQTDANGVFHFINLHPGEYTVEELFTDEIEWGATVDHDGDTFGDATTTVTVGSGEELVARDGDAGLVEGEDPQHEVNVGIDLLFGNMALGGCGLSPGFWSQHLWLWDGSEATNGPVDGQGVSLAYKLAAAGTVEEPEMMDLFPQHDGANPDADNDGKTDLVFETTDGRCLVIEWDDAQEIINMSNNTGGDKLAGFVRMAANTFLNDIGAPDFNAPADILSDIADWLLQYAPTVAGADEVADCFVLQYNNAGEAGKDGFGPAGNTTIKANATSWQTGDSDTPAGSEIFDAMVALICDDNTGTDLVTSADESYVVSGECNEDYFAIQNVTPNDLDGYLLLV